MLKPGGIFLFVDGDLQLYNEKKMALPNTDEEGQPGFCWLQRLFFAWYNSMKSRGASVDGPTIGQVFICMDF